MNYLYNFQHKFFIILFIFICLISISCFINNGNDNSSKTTLQDNNTNIDNNDDESNNSNMRQSISQHGITWTFDKPYRIGQYVNGDFWVIGPVAITSIDPPSENNAGIITNGSMINPDPNSYENQGFDSRMNNLQYVHELNVARPYDIDLSTDNMLIIPTGSSLISSISGEEGTAANDSYIDIMAIVTIVSEVPVSNSFRPSYVGVDKSSLFNTGDIDYSLLPQLAKVSNIPTIEEVTAYFEKPWIDYISQWTTGQLIPEMNGPIYGREYAKQTSIAALMLSLDFTSQEKEPLLIRYIQLGIDLYGAFIGGARWEASGGWMQGRKLPIVFAAAIFKDTGMQNAIGSVVDDNFPFQEDGSTFYISESDVVLSHETWSSSTVSVIDYQSSDIGRPEWGTEHSHNPLFDNRNWEASYRRNCGRSAVGTALAALILGFKSIWNWNAFFDYHDVFMAMESDLTDHEWMTSSGGQGSLFVRRMWETYRSDYTDMYVWPER